MKDYIISKLTELLIKVDFYERKNNVTVYIKKKDAYRDLIKFFKENWR